MGLFGQSSPFDADIEKATSEKNTAEPWGLIMDVCDKVSSNPKNAKDCLKAIMRRMAHNDPHVVIQALTLLDACVNNCGKSFHLEVASREFENEFKRLLSKAQPQVASKMRLLLKKWAENDFKSDSQLNLIPSLYQKLKSEGHDFSDSQKAPKSSTPAAALKDPNVVTSQQEEEDIAKAIELSLKDAKGSPKKQQTSSSTYPSLYPSFTGASALNASSSMPEPRKVRALYDFEAAEENELTFFSGEILHVLDDTDPNWWKGYNQRGEGLFPSNFVTADLSVEPEKFEVNQKLKKSVQFDDDAKKDDKTDSKLQEEKPYTPEINEEKIDRLLHLLHEANPEDPSQDSAEMLRLEEEVNKMGPLIDAELERVDRKHAQLTQLSSDLVDAINLYHTLMREPERPNIGPVPPLSGPINFMPGYNSQQSLYGPNTMFGMPNMYHHEIPSSLASASLPPMPMVHIMPGQQPNAQQGHPPQLPIIGNPGPTGFASHPTQVIPMQFQNGHPPSTPHPPPQQQQPLHQQPATHHNSIQSAPPPAQQGQQVQQHQQGPPPQQQHGPSQQQQNAPPHQAATPQHPVGSQPNSNFLPQNPMPTFTHQPGNFPPHLQTLPPGPYNIHPQMPPIIPNGPMGNLIGPPPLGIPNQTPLSLPQQIAAINQPVTQTILGQNDSKTNIPVYQQQR